MQVVRLREMFPQGHGFVLVFDYMLSDLSQVIRNMEQQLTEVSWEQLGQEQEKRKDRYT